MRRHRWSCALGVATLWAASGCVQVGPTIVQVHASQNVVVQTHVRADLGRSPEPDAFDPRDARLVKAMDDTARVVGHGVAFDFDLPALPRPQRPFLETLFARGLGRVPAMLESLREEDPDAFAFSAPRLASIAFAYDGTAEYPRSAWSDRDGTEQLTMTPDALFRLDAFASDWVDAYHAHLESRFAGRSAREIQPDQWPAYVRYIDRVLARDRARVHTEPGDDPLAHATLAMLELESLVPADHSLRATVVHWLASRANRFTYLHGRGAPAGSALVRAESAWSAWADRAFASLTDDDRHTLLSAAAEDASSREPALRVDAFAWGATVIREWIAAGHPAPESSRMKAVTDVIPPVIENTDGTVDPYRASTPWTRAVLRSPQGRARLTELTVQLRDPVFVRHMTTPFARVEERNEGDDALLAFWRALEPELELWSSATRVLAALAEPRSRALYDASARIWRERPGHRPALLALLVTLDVRRDSPYHLVNWSEFPRLFGSFITQGEYDAFLAQGNAAVDQAWKLFPALARGVSPTRSLLPRMARPVGNTGSDAPALERARTTLAQLIRALTERGDRAEVTAVRSYLDARAQQGSSDDRAALGALVEMTRRAAQ